MSDILFDTIVFRRVSNINNFSGRELQLWIDGVNILPNITKSPSNNVNNAVLGETTEFFIFSTKKTKTAFTYIASNYTNENFDLGVTVKSGTDDVSLYIPLTESINYKDIQSIIYYGTASNKQFEKDYIKGMRIELYNRHIDPTISTPLVYTETIDNATGNSHAFRFDFPAIDTYPGTSFVSNTDGDAESYTNITNDAFLHTYIDNMTNWYIAFPTYALRLDVRGHSNLLDISAQNIHCSGILRGDTLDTNDLTLNGEIMTELTNNMYTFVKTLPSIYNRNSYNTFGNLSGTNKWFGGVLAPNGKIYGFPANSNPILEFDPISKTTTTLNSVNATNKWKGGVLAPDGKIYGIPNTRSEILIINPVGGTNGATNLIRESIGSALIGYSGGVLAPNGKIYGIPNTATNVLVLTRASNSVSVTTIPSTPTGYSGGVLAPNGNIYCVPDSNSTYILVINPVDDTFSTITNSNNGYAGGVLATNGNIYCIPNNASSILEIDPINGTTSTFGDVGTDTNKWTGGVLAPNGNIYGIPNDASSILEIDPINKTTSTFGSVGTGTNKWSGGVLAPNGNIYGIPSDSSTILEIIPYKKYGVNFIPPRLLEAYSNKY